MSHQSYVSPKLCHRHLSWNPAAWPWRNIDPERDPIKSCTAEQTSPANQHHDSNGFFQGDRRLFNQSNAFEPVDRLQVRRSAVIGMVQSCMASASSSPKAKAYPRKRAASGIRGVRSERDGTMKTSFMKRPGMTASLILAGIFVFGLAAYAQQAGTALLDPTAPLTAEAAAQLSQNVNRPVIVIMKNRLSGAQAASDQAPVMSELQQVNARQVKSFRLVNSFAATVSEGEVARLKVNPGGCHGDLRRDDPSCQASRRGLGCGSGKRHLRSGTECDSWRLRRRWQSAS